MNKTGTFGCNADLWVSKKMSQALPGIGKEIFQRKEMNNKKINWDKKDFNQGYNFLWPAISGCL